MSAVTGNKKAVGLIEQLSVDKVCIVRMMTNTDNVESSLLTSIY